MKTKARRRLFWLLAVILPLVIYGGYAVGHTARGIANGCGRDAILSTMFPLRQLHLQPRAEELWQETVSDLLGDGESSLSSLGWALADSLKAPMMDLIYHGDCQTIDNLAESLAGLGLSLNGQGSN